MELVGSELYPRDVLDPSFDAMVVSGEVGLRQPDPEIFRLVAAELGVAETRCVLVDDHPGHLEAPRAAGMRTVLHRTPAQTIAELEEAFDIPLRPAPGTAFSGNS